MEIVFDALVGAFGRYFGAQALEIGTQLLGLKIYRALTRKFRSLDIDNKELFIHMFVSRLGKTKSR